MASIKEQGKRFQLRVKHKLLPRPFHFTFDTRPEAVSYGDRLTAMLDRGVVPQELLAPAKTDDDPLVSDVIRGYTQTAPVTDSDNELLGVVLGEVLTLRVSGITFKWCETYVHSLKTKSNLAPSTIRKRVGALARVIDWHIRRTTPKDTQPAANPLRMMPVGYSSYSKIDEHSLKGSALMVKRDQVRDRRLPPADEARVRAALAGVKRDDRERALEADPAFNLLFDLILDTGLRLSEAYRLRTDQVDFDMGVIRVEGSKGHRGAIKPRVVPLKPVLRKKLAAWCKDRVGLLFPFWDGTPEGRKRASAKLSIRFRVLFEYAGVQDVTEHDLRHEATCRWVELRNRGHWVFSEIEVCRIMGWTDTRMMLRYASLRGEDLANRLM